MASEDSEKRTATLSYPGGEHTMEIVEATEGASGVSLGKMLGDTGLITLDPGYGNTGACSLDDHLHRRRRGHPALPRLPDRAAGGEVHLRRDQLPADLRRAAERSSSWTTFTDQISRHTMLHEDLKQLLRRLPRRRAPDGGAVVARSARCRPSTATRSTRSTSRASSSPRVRLLAKVPTIAAYAYKKSIGQPFLYPDNSLGLVENFLHMMFGLPGRAVRGRPGRGQGAGHAAHPARRPRAELLDVDGAAWSARRRRTCSPRSPAGISALLGPLHGGANQAVLEMLEAHPRRRRQRRRRSSRRSRTRSRASG